MDKSGPAASCEPATAGAVVTLTGMSSSSSATAHHLCVDGVTSNSRTFLSREMDPGDLQNSSTIKGYEDRYGRRAGQLALG